MLDVKEVFDALENVENTSSTNEKKALLESCSDNVVLRCLLYWTYNPFYRYYSNKVELYINESENPKLYSKHIKEFKRILAELNGRIVTGNKARDKIVNFLNKCDNVEQKWYSRVITRDLCCGINVRTINKIYPDLIPTFPVALADKQNPIVLPTSYCVQDKFDGYRCVTDIHRSQSTMLTRNGKTYDGYDEIEEIMDKCFPSEWMFDGELISDGSFKGTQSSAFKKSKGKKATYQLFDCLPRKDFYSANGYLTLRHRQSMLHEFIEKAKVKAKKLGLDFSCINEVENVFAYDAEAKSYYYKGTWYQGTLTEKQQTELVMESYDDCLARGLEGSVIKDLNSLYMPGKSYSSYCGTERGSKKWYAFEKLKPFDTFDLVVDSVYEGTGEFVGMLGGVNVLYPASDGNTYLVGVGSGFKKDERIKFWKNKNLIIGKTIEVYADHETQNDDGGYSLRFTRYKGVRYDK